MKNSSFKCRQKESTKTTIAIPDSFQREIAIFDNKKKSQIDFNNIREGYISFGGEKNKPFFKESSLRANWQCVYEHIYHTKHNIIDQQKQIRMCRRKRRKVKDGKKRGKSPSKCLSVPDSPSSNKLRLSVQGTYLPCKRENRNKSIQESEKINKRQIGSVFLNIMSKIYKEKSKRPRSKLSQLRVDAENFKRSSLQEISIIKKHLHTQFICKGRRKNKNLEGYLYSNNRNRERANRSFGPIEKVINESVRVLSSEKKISSIGIISNHRNRERFRSTNVSFS
ncbi:unnamed protein product [Moneuplotes crassus]|uniref:Uncharacterized protein n=1 Tax=Euplotes crassus TaxID=5936 RepID=A0AAD1U672_EUPCR|nr:unnamed protein product [Moneuplotes crassus]